MRRAIALAIVVALFGCRSDDAPSKRVSAPVIADAAVAPVPAPRPDDPYAADRHRMVERTVEARGIHDPAVLDAMRIVPRHEMVPHDVRDQAYDDRALPIGFGLTISQPFIVGTMTAAASVHRGDKVLEIGTGSGYQAAVLAEMGADVYTIEIVPALAERTRKVLAMTGYDRVHVKVGDGYYGWADAAPFDAILVTAAAPRVPEPLMVQLEVGGKLVIPLGEAPDQHLSVVIKEGHGKFTTIKLFDVLFGPMTGAVRNVP